MREGGSSKFWCPGTLKPPFEPAVRDILLRRHTIDFPADLRTRLSFSKTNEASSMDSFTNSRVRIVDRAPQNNGKSILRTTVAEELCMRILECLVMERTNWNRCCMLALFILALSFLKAQLLFLVSKLSNMNSSLLTYSR